MITVDGITFGAFKHIMFGLDQYHKRKAYYCTCGTTTAAATGMYSSCSGCGKRNIVHYKESKLQHFLLSISYVAIAENHNELRINRYDLMTTIDPALPVPTLWVRKKGWMEFNYETRQCESFILKGNAYVCCDTPSQLTSYQNRRYVSFTSLLNHQEVSIRENNLTLMGLDRKTIEKCDYLYTRTGVKELFFEHLFDTYPSAIQLSGVIDYLAYWCKYPKIEALTKSGHFELAQEVYRKNEDLTQVLGRKRLYDLPKFIVDDPSDEFKELTSKEVKYLTEIHQNGKGIDLAFWDYLKTYKLLSSRELSKISDIVEYGFSVAEILSYLQRVDIYQACLPSESVGIWRDYLRMAVNANLEYEKFPRSLKRSHDIMSRENRYVFDKKTEQKFLEISPKWSLLSYSGTAFEVVSPTSARDLITEGKALHHCVGGYIKAVSEEKTIIMFVRKKVSVDEPFYTMEIRDQTVVQLKGKINRLAHDPSLVSFIHQYAKNKKLNVKYS